MNERARLEERVARIEWVLTQMDKRLNHVETEIVALRNELKSEIRGSRRGIDERFTRIDERFTGIEGDIKTNFRWVIGIMLTTWVTIILTIILKG